MTGAHSEKCDAIEEAKKTAEKEGRNVVIEAAGMRATGLPGAADALVCRVDAVEDCAGPCVYVGIFRDGRIEEWIRYRPRPVVFMPPPPPPMMMMPMMGGFGGGGC